MKGTDAGPPWLIIPSRITLKPAAGKRFLCGSVCQLHSATPAQWLVFLSWCGFLGLWYINETQRFGSRPVWFCCCGPVLRWTYVANCGPHYELGRLWDKMPGSSGHTKEAPRTWQPAEVLHRLLSLGPLFNTVCCSWFPLSSSLKGVPVPLHRLPLGSPLSRLWLRHRGHRVQRWAGFRVQRSLPTFLSTFSQTAPFYSSLPASWELLLLRAFPPLGRIVVTDLLIGTLKL